MKKDLMKKMGGVLAALTVSAITLTACGKEQALLTSQDYDYSEDMDQTSRGVSVGDDKDAFLAAYGEYEILTSRDSSNYELLSTEEIPFDEPITTILPTFMIDGMPTTLDTICKENEIAKADVITLLSSEEYLQQHTVMYYYLTFTWQDGIITKITSQSMNYNEDAAYYKDLQ